MRNLFKIILVLLLCFPYSYISYAAIPTAERQALITIYNTTDGDNWTLKTGWKTAGVFSDAGSECGWHGVSCDAGDTTVVQLALEYNNLTGDLPGAIADLVNLERIYLSGDQLTGSIPVALGNLSQLQIISINDNQLSGSLPAELVELQNLELLSMSNNELTGILPPELGGLMKLKTINLNYNRLSGSIPVEWGNLENLQILTFYSNQLSGEIPATFLNLSKLNEFSPDYNALHTENAALLSFLNDRHYMNDILATQTLDPENVRLGGGGLDSISLSWDPVTFTDAGGYRAYAIPLKGLYNILDVPDKTQSSATFNNLPACTVYRLLVRSYTLASVLNKNEVLSDGQTGNREIFMTGSPTGCAPVIIGGLGNHQVSESAPIGTEITDIESIDTIQEGVTTYRITQGDDAGVFAIDNHTGVISLAATLDYETTNHYVLTVSVDDGEGNTVFGNVIVDVTDVDEPQVGAGSGGGGCTVRQGAMFDPLLPLLVIWALVYLLRKNRAIV